MTTKPIADKEMSKDEALAVLDAAIRCYSRDGAREEKAQAIQARATIAAWNVSPSADAKDRVVEAAKAFIGSATLNSAKGRELRAALSQLAQQGGESKDA